MWARPAPSRGALRGAAARIIRAAGVDLADALLGRSCLGCGGALERGAWVCGACDARIPRTGVVLCLDCLVDRARDGREAAATGEAALEAAPEAAPRSGCPRHGSDRLLLAGPPFVPPLDAVIRAFKYSGSRAGYHFIASLLPEPPGAGTAAWREWILVPVPLHPARRAWRGFDQARLLAEAAGSRWGLPVASALERRRDHAPQARTRREERRENVRGAFTLTPDGARLARGRAVLLVDDVATTGSTLLEAWTAVSECRPAWVLSLTAAHGGTDPA